MTTNKTNELNQKNQKTSKTKEMNGGYPLLQGQTSQSVVMSHFLRFVGISDCPLWIIFPRNVVFRPRSIVGGVLKLAKESVKATPDYYWSIGRNFYKRIISGSIFFLSLS